MRARSRLGGGEAEIIAPKSLIQLVNHLKGNAGPGARRSRARSLPAPEAPDLKDVKGQESAKRALSMAAAAGGHNLLMVGPPGLESPCRCAPAGASLPLTPEEMLEISMVQSMAGLLGKAGG
ncbi:MAG: ATP-binding protein [Parvularculaceae bacterium]